MNQHKNPYSERKFSVAKAAPTILALAVMVALGLGMSLVGCSRSDDNSADVEQSAVEQANQSANEATEQGTSLFSVDVNAMNFGYEASDLDATYDDATATHIVLNGSSATVDGPGVAVLDDGNVTISSGGTYVVSGEFSDGQIAVDSRDAAVQIVLNGALIKNADGPALFVANAPKVYLTLGPSSMNILGDSQSYVLQEGDNDPYGAVFSNADLTINGSGSLEVNGAYKHGVATMGVLAITGGKVEVSAVEDSLYGNNAVKIHDGSILLTSGQDAIKVENEEDDSFGFASIDGGAVTIEAGDDGVKAARFFQVSGGELTIEAAGDGFNSDHDGSISSGMVTITVGDDAAHAEYVLVVSGGVVEVLSCVEGYEAEKVYIQEGTSYLTSSDDAINAAAPEEVKAAEEAAAGTGNTAGIGDATDAGEAAPSEGEAEGMGIARGGAMVGGEQPPEFAEGAEPPTPPTGERPPDMPEGADSAAAAGGFPPQGGMGGESQGYDDCLISISGGYLAINAEGDGIDSNGNAEISGGVVLVAGPSSGDNSAFDYDLAATITGGTVIMVGSSGMAQGFSGGTQPFALVNVDGAAESSVALTNDGGEVVASFSPHKAFQSVLVSVPGVTEGQTMQLVIGGTVSPVNQDGYTAEGTVEGGTVQEVVFSTHSTQTGMGGPGEPRGSGRQ